MSTPRPTTEPNLGPIPPTIDGDFDRFELTTELEETLREAPVATFYHEALEEHEDYEL